MEQVRNPDIFPYFRFLIDFFKQQLLIVTMKYSKYQKRSLGLLQEGFSKHYYQR